jgi:hypothetical protein
MIAAGDPEGRRCHDSYHRFFRAARWSTNALWKVLVLHMDIMLCPSGPLPLDCDDTLYKKSGRKIEGAGTFRDAVRSTRNKVVYATGLNLVVVACLGAEDPQCWKREGPERAASLSLWLYAAIWTWYIPTFGTTASLIPRPWYLKKATPSFLDALTSLRRVLWAERITPVSSSERISREILDGLLNVLATEA